MDVQHALTKGLQALNNGELVIAEQHFNLVLNAIADEPNALFLLGGVRQKQQRFSEAEQLMQRALKNHSQPADVLNSLGNLMGKMQQPEQAVNYYLKAIEKRPHFASAFFNLGLVYRKIKQNDKAITALTTASTLSPNNIHIWTALGGALQDDYRLEDALKAFDKALAIQPNYTNALHNKGVTLRMLQRPQDALVSYQQALPQGENIPELHFNMGCAFYDADQKDQADKSINHAIALKPDYVLAHETLNKMYWEHQQTDKFTLSFQKAIKQLPDSPDLRVAYANQLKMAKRTEEAANILDSAIKELGPFPQLSHSLGLLYGQTGNAERAVEHISNAVIKAPDDDRYRIDVANFLIQETRYSEAMNHLDVAQRINAFEQEMWALKGLCWRFTGDEREAWLNNYDQFVQAKVLDTPQGYDNLEHFIYSLKKVLVNMHKTVKTPLDQSVRYGTQTPGRLLYQPVKEILDYRTVLEKRIREYLAGLPDDPSHPFLSRKSDNFRFSGSWSVRLKSEGFHVNHVHPDGWFSGPTYIAVPDSIHADDPNKAGWVTFGETGMNLGAEREKIAVSVCPQEGLCAFFPSYVWHGTIPFSSEHHRMTTPCDVIPV
jgi:tetratricopeptide (TPR) repeat protein